tara:strand:- start:140 stop:280 length:141 start_codon:yes stop_codon:yes gene_type:complete
MILPNFTMAMATMRYTCTVLVVAFVPIMMVLVLLVGVVRPIMAVLF